ncbi:MAG: sulfatase [Phycisphaeraceae bacterium]
MTRPNVLFIPVDDLRPQLGCYGRSQMKTPHMDRLAAEGTVYENAYCQVPVCGASRASLLSGLRPTRTRFVDFLAAVDEDMPGALTLPEHFRHCGYETVSVGKVFHHNHDTGRRSWTREPWHPAQPTGGAPRGGRWRNYLTPEAQAQARADGKSGPPFECAEVMDNAYHDGQIADRAIHELSRMRGSDRPFFLAAGFLKPHLPFNAPKKYWDLYREDDLSLADNPFAPENAPSQAVHNSGELRNYFDVPKQGPLPESLQRQLVHGYYAATSYVDAQIGRVLRALEDFQFADHTIVCLWGDHGWQLGEHGMWCKHCNFETSLNAPMIFRVPGQKPERRSRAIVEFLDIYPTLCDLADLSIPTHLHGTSLASTIEDEQARVKHAAYSRWYAGESIRTENYLYTQWTRPDGAEESCMLFDHDADPDENVNIATDARHADRIERYNEMLARTRAEAEAAGVD